MTRPDVKRGDAWVGPALMATMAVWGLNFPMVKTLTQWFDTALLASARIVAAAVAFWVLLAWARPPRLRLAGRQWLGLPACAFTMVYLNQVLFAGGLQRTGAANGALIMATSPMVAGLLAALAFGERLHRRHLGALVLGFGGVAVVVLHRPGAALGGAGLGDLMILGCVVSYALGGVIVQHLAPRVDLLSFNAWVYTLGMGMLLLHLGIEQGPSLSVQQVFPGWWPWTLVIVSAVLATTLSNWLWAVAIARIGVARTTVFVYWVPVFGMGFSALLLGEALNAWYGLGLAMVLAGSRLAASVPRRAAFTPPVE
ncbi:MAG: DMT family transporter [Rubrivivax sp.]